MLIQTNIIKFVDVYITDYYVLPPTDENGKAWYFAQNYVSLLLTM